MWCASSMETEHLAWWISYQLRSLGRCQVIVLCFCTPATFESLCSHFLPCLQLLPCANQLVISTPAVSTTKALWPCVLHSHDAQAVSYINDWYMSIALRRQADDAFFSAFGRSITSPSTRSTMSKKSSALW
jgi:hypothetical protein